jgi:hypothetical protein
VERLGIAHRVVAPDSDQREHESVVIEQHVEVLVSLADWAQAEVSLEELPGRGHVIDREVYVVEFHRSIFCSVGDGDSVPGFVSKVCIQCSEQK